MNPDIEPRWDSSALITIDLQQDFLSDGAFGVPGTTEVLPVVRTLIQAFRDAGRPIIHAVRLYLADGSNADISRRQSIRAGASIVRPGTPGAELAPDLLPAPVPLDAGSLLRGELQPAGDAEHILFKPRWSAFYATPLDAWLRSKSVDTVVVVGCNYPNCPRGTLFGASERDYRAVAVSDATSRWTASAAEELAGIGIVVADSRFVVAALR